MSDQWIVSRQDEKTVEKVYWTKDETWSRDKRRAKRMPLTEAADILGANRGLLCGPTDDVAGFGPAKTERALTRRQQQELEKDAF